MTTDNYYLLARGALDTRIRPLTPPPAQRAAEIVRRADHLLALGRHIQAERLAHIAADLREAVRV